MKTRLISATVAMWSVALIPLSKADTLELRNGGAIQGKYVGGTATTIQIETGQGVQTIATADVASLKLSAVPPAPRMAVPQAPAAPAAPVTVTIPAGTVLTIRMESQVSSTDRAGTKFSAKLVADLVAGETTVAKAGANVFGQVDQSKQAGRLAGKSQLAISLIAVDVGGKQLPIATTNFAEAGKGEFRRTARNVAGGALIGNAIDDDGGAGVGAAVGVGASLIKKGDSVTVPPGALLEFRLTQPVSVSIQ